jgi:Putative zinc-finger
MSCDDFEMLMADALGGEMADSDRAQFEGHLAFCATCRGEYQSMVGAVEKMRSLPGSSLVSEAVAREAISIDVGEGRGHGHGRGNGRGSRSGMGALYRYAACILFAFGAGYVLRGEARSELPVDVPTITETAKPTGVTLETALVSAHRKKPGGSSLSMAMTAMFSGN